jgi:hypothetical protein
MLASIDQHEKSYLWCRLLMSVDTKNQFSIMKKIREPRSMSVRPRSGPAVIDLPRYMSPLVEDGGHRPPSQGPMSRTEGGCLRGHAYQTHGPPCLDAPRSHTAVEEEGPHHHCRGGGPSRVRHQWCHHGPGCGSSLRGGRRSAAPYAAITPVASVPSPICHPSGINEREERERELRQGK